MSAVTIHSKTAARLDELRSEGRAALIGYLPLGFPDLAGSIAAATAMVEAGVDIIELGVPYSDPVMDGPIIQRAVEHALAGGVRVHDVFAAVEQIARTGAPVLVMTYWNPVMHYGVDAFARDLAAAGGAGLITPDLIPDEAAEWIAASDKHGLDRVFIVAPSSTPDRLASPRGEPRGHRGERGDPRGRAVCLEQRAHQCRFARGVQVDFLGLRLRSAGNTGTGDNQRD